ncbi:MAG TPA: DNA replication/repair protein RecF [Chthonomonadaceae bacterium]|nr:DNA replication/repair protein RecF [Chthonomonadaceae bacterium]
MRIRQLKLTNFRNYRELELVPGEGLNLLHGANAQGKSNILEALSLLATTRSLRANRESEMIRHGAEVAHVAAEIDRERKGDVDLQVSIFQSDKKTVRINSLKRARVIELLGQFNAVYFGSISLAIVTGEPSERRRYLNVEISQISPRYVYDLEHYKRVLEQRNRLLRDLRERPRPPQESGLDAWNEQLVIHGAPLMEKRRFYIERLAPLADQIHRELTDGREGLEVHYLPNIPLPMEAPLRPRRPFGASVVRETPPEEGYAPAGAEGGAESPADSAAVAVLPEAPESPLSATEAMALAFRRQLSLVAEDELRRGVTLVGPQRDDLSFRINGMDARIYGSQGQQRTVALSLKLAEFRLIEEYVGEPPVMLLDDVMSDLDDTRRAHLLAWIRRRCQTFLTCTNLRSFPSEILAEATTFKVVAGTVTPDGNRETRTTTPAVSTEPTQEPQPGGGESFPGSAGGPDESPAP